MDKIIILDLGGQYTHLIANRVRRLNVYSEIMESDVGAEKLRDAKGIILSGGPSSVYDEDGLKIDKEILSLGIPVLGLCYGQHIIAQELGGKVESGKIKEYGDSELSIGYDDPIFENLEKKQTVWMSHGDSITVIPDGFKVIATTKDCSFAAMVDPAKKIYGIQFHPEVTHTPNGMKILGNFLFNVCNCDPDWNMKSYIEESMKLIKNQVGNRNIFLFVSGGIDSTVAFALLNKALGPERVYGFHVDNGLVRKDESKMVAESLKQLGFSNFKVIHASDEFVDSLKDIYAPEEKRKIIGNKFVEIHNRVLDEMKLDPDRWILGQGTIYPDTIETQGTKNADLIKTHHNRVKIIQDLIEQGKVIEPLANLYKDEVREVGIELGLPEHVVYRQPFPGPGLGVRCLCIDKPAIIENKDDVERKVNDIINPHNLKAFLLPIRSVGVQGDLRSYKHVVAIQGKADWELLDKLTTRLINTVKELNRVVYLISPDKIDKIEIKLGYITNKRLDLLRDADEIMMDALEENNLTKEVWQSPTVLIPVTINGEEESVVLRPVSSKEAMTARFSRLDLSLVKTTAKQISGLNGINAVFYDITNKPPATIEWE